MISDKNTAAAEPQALPAAAPDTCAAPEAAVAAAPGRRRQHLEKAAVATAAKLVPLMELLDSIKPHMANESVFRTRRKKINVQVALAYEQLKAERPKRKMLVLAFSTMAELVREEMHDISKDELKEAAKEFVLATLKNAPAIINAAHQAKLLS